MDTEPQNNSHSLIERPSASEVLAQVSSGQLLVVNSRRRNGLILHKDYHADFVGPGAAVGSFFDVDCQQVVPVGDLSLVKPTSYEERQTAYKIRLQWIRLIKRFTSEPVPLQRTRKILEQLEQYFDPETIGQIPDDTLARLVGVLPQTIWIVRYMPELMKP